MGRDMLIALSAAVVIAVIVASIMHALPLPGRGAEASRPEDPADGELVFVDVAEEIGLDFRHGAFRWEVTDDPSSLLGSGLCWIDFDRDGWMDLFVVNNWTESEWPRWQDEGGVPTSRLYRNERGSFVDVTVETGTGLDFHGQGCVAADFDSDGFSDLYVASTGSDALLWNVAGDLFREGGEDAGIASETWSTGVSAGDVNGDGLIDLFVADHDETPRLYLNLGDRRFAEAAAELGLDADRGRLGGSLVDVDADGDLDLIELGSDATTTLSVNEPADSALGFRFVRGSDVESPGPGADGASWGDFDLDGEWDRFDGSGDLASVAAASPVFESGAALADRTADVGLANVSIAGRSSAVADYDNDGDLDVAVGTVGGQLVLLSNRGAGGHWLGVDTSRLPPGTSVEVELPDGTTITRRIVAGSSYLSSDDPRAHFGLGTAGRVEGVTVRSPDGSEWIYGGIRTNRYLTPDPSVCRNRQEVAVKTSDDDPVFVSMAFDDIARPDFADVIIEPIPDSLPIESITPVMWAERVFGFGSAPRWVMALLAIRQAVVRLVGIPKGAQGPFGVDRAVGDEALISIDDRHLRFRAAVGVDRRRRLLRVTTVVELIGWRGRVYFAPVSILHPVVVRSMMRRAIRDR
jgi:hypothetical protein